MSILIIGERSREIYFSNNIQYINIYCILREQKEQVGTQLNWSTTQDICKIPHLTNVRKEITFPVNELLKKFHCMVINQGVYNICD